VIPVALLDSAPRIRPRAFHATSCFHRASEKVLVAASAAVIQSPGRMRRHSAVAVIGYRRFGDEIVPGNRRRSRSPRASLDGRNEAVIQLRNHNVAAAGCRIHAVTASMPRFALPAHTMAGEQRVVGTACGKRR